MSAPVEIREHRIELGILEVSERGLGRAHGSYVEALAAQEGLEQLTSALVVVDDQEGAVIHARRA